MMRQNVVPQLAKQPQISLKHFENSTKHLLGNVWHARTNIYFQFLCRVRISAFLSQQYTRLLLSFILNTDPILRNVSTSRRLARNIDIREFSVKLMAAIPAGRISAYGLPNNIRYLIIHHMLNVSLLEEKKELIYDILCMISTRWAQHFCWRRIWPWPGRF